METTVVEVRQPFCLPVNIRVPTWQRLKERQDKIQQLQRESKDYTSQLQQLERETPSPEVKAARERLEAKKAEAEARRERAQSEYDQLVEQVAFQLFRRQLLKQELENLPASDSPMTMRAMLPGEGPTRPRIEIMTELSECLNSLAWFSLGDEGLAAEATKVEAQLAEAWQQV